MAAASNQVWRAMMRHMHMPIRIDGLPVDLQAAWNLLLVPTPSESTPSPPLQSSPAVSLQNAAAEFYTIHVPTLRQAGCDCMLDQEALKFKGTRCRKVVLQQSRAELEFLEAMADKATKKQKAADEVDGSAHAVASTSSATPVLLQDAKKSLGKKSPGKKNPGKKNGKGGKSKKNPDEEVAARRPEAMILSGLTGTQRPGADTLPAGCTPSDHPLLGVKIKGSTSPKINFMVKEVRDYGRFFLNMVV